jgi:hypothetical protein
MLAMIRRIFSSKFLPVSWTLFTITLLCLPGSMVPGAGIFAFKNLDKIVHAILFGANVLFWGWHFEINYRGNNRLKLIYLGDTAIIILLGILLEYVQLYFIPNRSFDINDIVADSVGAILAGLWLFKG